jgi:hypothetical protein
MTLRHSTRARAATHDLVFAEVGGRTSTWVLESLRTSDVPVILAGRSAAALVDRVAGPVVLDPLGEAGEAPPAEAVADPVREGGHR